MAQIKPAPHISQLSGQTQPGSQTILYPRRRHTFSRIKRGTPWRNTPAQVRVTELNKAATAAFGSITDDQRDTWKDYAANFSLVHMGVEVPNTDLEMFISANFHRQLNELPISSTAPSITPESFVFTLLSTSYLSTGPGLLIEFNHTVLDIHDSFFIIRASTSFLSPARKARRVDYRLAGSMNHYSIFPVQPSPQTCYVPLSALTHTDNFYIWIAVQIVSPDYFKGIQQNGQVQLTLNNSLWYASPDHSITLNQSLNSFDVKISDVLVARLFQNGNLSLKGEVCEYAPADAPPAFNYISYHAPTTQIRFAYKTNSSPGFKTFFSIDASGDLNLFGELREFFNLGSLSETIYFHPYLNPRKLQISIDRAVPALAFFVDDAPQENLCLLEVTENEL